MAAVPPVVDQAGVAQGLQVEGEGGGRDLEALAEGAGRGAVGAGLHEQAVDREATLLRQRRERHHDLLRFHPLRFHFFNSMIIE